MTPHYTDPLVTLFLGDCLDVMRELPDASVDSVCTDPPYGLEFMGRHWDKLVSPERTSGHNYSDTGPDDRKIMFAGRPAYNAGPNPTCRKCGGLKFLASEGSGGRKRCKCDQPDFPNYQLSASRAMQAWHEQWATEAFRVLKPGGYLLAFGGTRTYHRLASAIEDAGFEIRDTLMWIYACLSDDTEILTGRGWLRYNEVSTDDTALAFDSDTGTLQWEPIEAVHQYDHEGEMVRLLGAGTDQLVTLNHRLVLVDGQGVAPLPRVSDDVLAVGRPPSEVPGPSLLDAVQRQAAHPRSSVSAGAVMERGAQTAGIPTDAGTAEPGLEGRRYLLQDAWSLYRSALRSGIRMGFADGPEGWVHHGAPATDGGDVRLPDDAGRSGEPREPRPVRQSTGEPYALALERGPQAVRVEQAGDDWSVLPSGPVSAAIVDYAGVVWCVTVPSGAFVARRRGLAFVTGNSGFPKSLDVSKALDKSAGAEREVVSEKLKRKQRNQSGIVGTLIDEPRYDRETLPATDLARKWEGWGTALKPAHEPIVMARKPLVGTVAANVTRYGTGALNIDGTRIKGTDEIPRVTGKGTLGGSSEGWDRPWKHDADALQARQDRADVAIDKANNLGRWPSNVLLSDPELFDEPNPWVVGSGATSESGAAGKKGSSGFVDGYDGEYDVPYGDSGGYSRFFLIPKADRAERERGLTGVNGARGNTHPTVKSLDLMRHLVRLVTPPGGVTLDPFLGSGTTALAASEEGFRCIGIEREAEYLEIAKGRLMATPMGLGLDVPAGTKPLPKQGNNARKSKTKGDGHKAGSYSGGLRQTPRAWGVVDEEDPAA